MVGAFGCISDQSYELDQYSFVFSFHSSTSISMTWFPW